MWILAIVGASALQLRTNGPCDAGLHDPFSDSYCQDVTEECKCRFAVATQTIESVCTDFPGAAGYDGCVSAIKTRIAEVDGCIKAAREVRQGQYNNTYDQIGDALGGRDLFGLAKMFPYGPFSGECVDMCREHDALCAYGQCNTQLDQVAHKVRHIKGYSELLGLKLQELNNLGGSC